MSDPLPPGEPHPPEPPALPPNRPPFAPPPGTPFYGSPPGAEWSPPPGTVFAGEPASPTTSRRERRAWPRKAPPVPADHPHHEEKGSRAVALLLAIAAVVAAIITARASLIASDAGDAWQASVSEEQRRGAMLLENVRYTFGTEGEVALMIASADVRAQEFRAEAARRSPEIAMALLAEADVQQQVLDSTRSASEVASDPRYALPSGGYDLELRLADSRQELGDDLSIDPATSIAAGDAASDRAIRLTAATLGVGLAFLLGALAQALRRPRRLLLLAGWLAVLVTVAVAIALETSA